MTSPDHLPQQHGGSHPLPNDSPDQLPQEDGGSHPLPNDSHLSLCSIIPTHYIIPQACAHMHTHALHMYTEPLSACLGAEMQPETLVLLLLCHYSMFHVSL